jgi:type IV pilus assembly protein PilV
MSMKSRAAGLAPGSTARESRDLPRRQGGVMLIEAIVAMLVFSVGVLALIGLQAAATREVTNAKFRSDASYIADRIVGDLSSVDLTAASLTARLGVFAGNYTPTAVPAGLAGSPEPAADTARAASWQASLTRGLPNARVGIAVSALNPPTVTIAVSWESPTGTASAAPCRLAGDTQPRACFVQVAIVSD